MRAADSLDDLASAWRNQRDDCLAGTAIAHRFTRVRCRRLSEWKHSAHDGPQLPGVQHRRNVAELPPIGLDKNKACFVRPSSADWRVLTMVTSRPPGPSTSQERCKVEPPTASNTTSTFLATSSKRSV